MKRINIKLKETGITLISLTITIIILIILASITTYSGMNTVKSSKLNKFKQELEIMQAEIDMLYEKYKNDETIQIGKELTSVDSEKVQNAFSAVGETDTIGYRVFDKQTLQELSVEGIENEYLVNIKKRQVISLEGFKSNGQIYYNLYQITGKNSIRQGIDRNGVTFSVNANVDSNNNLEISISNVNFSKYVGKGSIQYQIEGEEKWITVNRYYKGEDCSFTIEDKTWNTATTVKEAIRQNKVFKTNTELTDENGNKVTVPGGFKVTSDGENVGQGIVIQDVSTIPMEKTYKIKIVDAADEVGEQSIKIDGYQEQSDEESSNQFVWIPVGKYKTASGNEVTNNLVRRVFKKAGPEEFNEDEVIGTYYYGEGNSNSSIYGTEYSIDKFKTSASQYGGYYIGRYEAGTKVERISVDDTLEHVKSKPNLYPYTFVKKSDAIKQSQEMYPDNTNVKTTLMSSYAYDTAMNFVCQNSEYGNALALISITEGSNYANIYTGNKCKTGEYTKDCYSNICDFLGNVYEWSTEYSNDATYESVFRGSGYRGTGPRYPALRDYSTDSLTYVSRGFRVELYL